MFFLVDGRIIKDEVGIQLPVIMNGKREFAINLKSNVATA